MYGKFQGGGSSLHSAAFETSAQLFHVEFYCSRNNLRVEATYVPETRINIYQSTRGQIQKHLKLYLRQTKIKLQITIKNIYLLYNIIYELKSG